MANIKDLMVGAAERRSSLTDTALLILRVFTGLSLALAHGFGKLPVSAEFVEGVGQLGFPAPTVFAWAAALAESVGALCLAFGLLTRPAALTVLFTMLVAAFGVHAADPFRVKELALFYAVSALVFVILGAGRYSIDALLRRR